MTCLKTLYRAAFGIFVGCCTWFFTACKPDKPENPQSDPNAVSFAVPKGWPQPTYKFESNALSQAGFELGRKLFYETLLSKDNSISCGSCHQQFAAFSHLDHATSHGIYGLLGTRNAPGIFNTAWIPTFMWDGGINHIEVQPLGPITNPVEMNETLDGVITKLYAGTLYRSLFKSAFGKDTIHSQLIFRALAQFMGSMVSANSKYDKYVRSESGGQLNASELNGLQLFRSKCASCHSEPLFTDFSYRSNGLLLNHTYNDIGRVHITQNPADSLKFKVPSLRNIALTKPYMHDGRFESLEACLEHYTQNPQQFNKFTDTQLKNGLQLSVAEKTDIINFLKTLSDADFIKDVRFSEPKK